MAWRSLFTRQKNSKTMIRLVRLFAHNRQPEFSFREESFRQIHERVSDRLLDISPDYEQIQLNFHLTSVYDHSLHEAFSRVLHKLVPTLPYLEELLNVFCAVSLLFIPDFGSSETHPELASAESVPF